MEKDIVLDIKNKSFGTRNIAEKREILRAGRPTPVLKTKVFNTGVHYGVHYVSYLYLYMYLMRNL